MLSSNLTAGSTRRKVDMVKSLMAGIVLAVATGILIPFIFEMNFVYGGI